MPKTREEVSKSGYKFLNKGECRTCKREIEWWQTPAGNKMPMSVNYVGTFSGSKDIITSHFGDCPDREAFRKANKTHKERTTPPTPVQGSLL